ncbi:MBOAT family O-acyltransferase [Aminipila luticellarii]|uniref:MBOAT family protein n=1 Tax=Aminipila luticellarii TaxID=2507160 RepID=A0A410PVF1_9FIRM|nr:MBOAT family protein [Aminipila luticellarii]QAT42922.1 MBOAT family protein [Aminipila luticellarii]
MLFSSIIFISCFLPIVLFLYYTIFRFSRSVQNIFLLIISLGFYAWGAPKFVFLLILSVLANWMFGLILSKVRADKIKSRIIIILMLIYNLSIIFVFKYLMFTMKNIQYITGLDFTIPKIALPIGISFFTFKAISYVIDVYKEKGPAQKNPLHVGLYITFFPQLLAGPIERYENFADQIENRKESFDDVSAGVCRFLVGLSKKVLLANNLALVADKAFKLLGTDDLSLAMAWLGAICYTLQIYYDFSGYSDMAIGLGRMFGFHTKENFNYPYISKSTTEFWRRWHISLGSWFRDYVYIPLGGNRVKTKQQLFFNVFAVWALTGLWHGANWTFICWGLLYFVSISAEKAVGLDKMESHSVLRHIYTMLLVMFGWVLFRADNIVDALVYLKTMFVPGGGGFIDADAIVCTKEYIVFLFFGILFSRPFAKKLAKTKPAQSKPAQILYVIALMVLFFACISYMLKSAYNPFIYFNF